MSTSFENILQFVCKNDIFKTNFVKGILFPMQRCVADCYKYFKFVNIKKL